ncbi:MAG TPA: MFS transporter [Vicinamibacterales bacterium]|jgi:MFS family permease|nr:MFS transporter [Vicinamibacterales bacterium]
MVETQPAPDVTAPTPTFLFSSKTLQRMFAAFSYRDFRVQWFGACTSSVGSWTQNAAQNWMVLSLTGSAFYLGLDTFLQQLPLMLFMLVGGVLADRRDRRKTLLASQYIQMTTAMILGILVFSGVVRIWEVLTLSFATGFAQAFGGPAYQALIPELVDKRDLPNAVAFNGIQVNIARFLGPLAFGATITVFALWHYSEQDGMAACFVVNSFSFLVVIYTLMSLHVKHIPSSGQKRTMGAEMKSGLSYVFAHADIVALTILAAATTFLGFAVLTFLPVFTQSVFHEGAGTYSRLLAFSAAGSVLGSLIVAWLGKFPRMGLTSLIIQAIFGLLIVGFALSRTIWISEVLLFFMGVSMMIVFSTTTSLVQLIAPNDMRGRVMSIYMVAFRGGMPLGSLTSGYVATFVGAPKVIAVNGVLLICVALYFLLAGDRRLRQI